MDAKFDAEAAIADYVRRLWSNFGGVSGVIYIRFTYLRLLTLLSNPKHEDYPTPITPVHDDETIQP